MGRSRRSSTVASQGKSRAAATQDVRLFRPNAVVEVRMQRVEPLAGDQDGVPGRRETIVIQVSST